MYVKDINQHKLKSFLKTINDMFARAKSLYQLLHNIFFLI